MIETNTFNEMMSRSVYENSDECDIGAYTNGDTAFDKIRYLHVIPKDKLPLRIPKTIFRNEVQYFRNAGDDTMVYPFSEMMIAKKDKSGFELRQRYKLESDPIYKLSGKGYDEYWVLRHRYRPVGSSKTSGNPSMNSFSHQKLNLDEDVNVDDRPFIIPKIVTPSLRILFNNNGDLKYPYNRMLKQQGNEYVLRYRYTKGAYSPHDSFWVRQQ